VTTATDPCAHPDAGPDMLAADADRPSALWRIMGFVSPVLVVLLFLIVTVVGWAILDPLTWRDRARAALFVGWIAVVLLVAFQL
jgi:hypothetical protein